MTRSLEIVFPIIIRVTCLLLCELRVTESSTKRYSLIFIIHIYLQFRVTYGDLYMLKIYG